ncbi:type II secretion system minor pseudopilin GspK [Pseudidiomarina salinarum]|uniref:type II secretion system minor pseudopilin GspK n=1 Tax=Pseudidiomarina salinarum TaxID=435908 RepID=UPI00054DDF80|nr:type II secretion system minor pseudopilin GspK [Pseudidiomarina salinarum]RUO70906.1 type II secretory pathway protein [Pseudidiomarina salinarum]
MRQQRSMKQQRGVALIIVMLVVALVSVIAVNMSGRMQTSVVRTANFQEAEQAYWYALSAEEIVKDLLLTELKDADGVVHRQQQWYLQSQNAQLYPVEGGAIGGVIRDLQACFNLNALKTAPEDQNLLTRRKAQLRMLMTEAMEEPDSYTIDVVVDSLADWLDEDSELGGSYGAEDADYESLRFPYRAANGMMTHISEFRLVRGVSQALFLELKPYICVLPRDSKLQINVNTVEDDQSALLYAVTLGAMSLSDAAGFLQNRPESGYDSLDAARAAPALTSAAAAKLDPNLGGGVRPDTIELGGALDDLNVTSEYFGLQAEIRFGELRLHARSQFLVTPEGVTTVYRGFGD